MKRLIGALGLSLGLLSANSHAALGGTAASLAQDKVQLQATVTTTATADYQEVTLNTTDGSIITEFVSLAGQVFAVAWSGPWRPDLSQLLGDFYPTYQAQMDTPRTGRHHTPVVDNNDLVVRHGGHPRSFHGLAYVRSLTPAGVNANTLMRVPK